MEITMHESLRPKNKRGALKQAVQSSLILESKERKEKNIMKRQEEVQTKISRLELELDRLNNDLKILQEDKETYRQKILDLKTQFELTDLEIQDLRLQTLQRNLREQEALLRAAGIEAKPSKFTE